MSPSSMRTRLRRKNTKPLPEHLTYSSCGAAFENTAELKTRYCAEGCCATTICPVCGAVLRRTFTD